MHSTLQSECLSLLTKLSALRSFLQPPPTACHSPEFKGICQPQNDLLFIDIITHPRFCRSHEKNSFSNSKTILETPMRKLSHNLCCIIQVSFIHARVLHGSIFEKLHPPIPVKLSARPDLSLSAIMSAINHTTCTQVPPSPRTQLSLSWVLHP